MKTYLLNSIGPVVIAISLKHIVWSPSSLISLDYVFNLSTRGMPAVYKDHHWYTSGPYDWFNIAFFLLPITMFISTFEAVLGQHRPAGLKNSDSEANKFKHACSVLLANVLFIVWMIWICLTAPGGFSAVWEGYPEGAMPLVVKVCSIAQICFWLQSSLKIMIQPDFYPDDKLWLGVECVVLTTILSVMHMTEYTFTGLVFVTIRYGSHFFKNVTIILADAAGYREMALFIACLHHVATGVEKVAWIGLSGWCLMDTRIEGALKTIMLCALLLSCGWTVISVLRIVMYGRGLVHPGRFTSGKFGFPALGVHGAGGKRSVSKGRN